MTTYGKGRSCRPRGKGFRIWILRPGRFIVDLYGSDGKRPSWCQDYLPSHAAAVAWIENFTLTDRRWRYL